MITYNASKLLHKQAGVYSDALLVPIPKIITGIPLSAMSAAEAVNGNVKTAALYGGLNDLVQYAAEGGSYLHGLLGSGDDDKPVEALREMNDNAGKALIPLVGDHRLARRPRLVSKLLGGDSKYLHEILAHVNPINWVGAPVGTLAALIDHGRTIDEQAEEEKDAPWKDWLIPGMATYNIFKRLGVSNRIGDSKKGDDIDRAVMKYVKSNKKQ